MTAPRTTTIRVPLPTLTGLTLTLAAIGTIAVIPHLIVAAHKDLPPQFMTAHSFTVIGLWLAFFHYRAEAHRIETVEKPASARPPGPQQRHIDNDADVINPIMLFELDNLEQRLRDNDW